MREQKLATEYDNKGRLWIDCCECTCGINGNQSCSSGLKCISKFKGGCIEGTLQEQYKSLLKPFKPGC